MSLEQVLQKTLSAAVAPPKSTPINVSGKWVNEYQSTAEFVISGEDITGTYTSTVSSTGREIKGAIKGYITGDTLAFSVLWNTPAESITSWVGQIVDLHGTETLKTLWQLVVNLPDDDEPTGLWTSIYAGADNFTRVA